jgi:hypothetical protein
MGERDYYKDAKQTLSQTGNQTSHEATTERNKNARLAGVILHPWLPVSWTRRPIMAGIVVLGVQQAIWVGNYEAFVWWLLLPFFSPRIEGECAFQIGRVVGWFKRRKPQHLYPRGPMS